MRLVPFRYIRAKLRAVSGGARVTPAAVEAAHRELVEALNAIAARAQRRYELEVQARRAQGLYPRGLLREDHVAPQEEPNAPAGGVADDFRMELL